VNGVSPGAVAFPPDYDDDLKRRILQRVPLGTEGSPDDVAAAVVFLTQAPYITGHIIAVDGGRSARL
jgi:pteridine reductase